MKISCRTAVLACLVWIFLSGCGGNPPSIAPPTSQSCSGVVISGTLQDSLTRQPVAQGTAVLESGTELSVSRVYEFLPIGQTATDAHGGFSLCAQSANYPSAIVLEALDSVGKAYPPYVTAISGTTDMGTIAMGECTMTCGFFQGEQQTATPATITGVITSAPIAVAGTVVPQYALEALDGSKTADGYPNLWSLAMPVFNASPVLTFNTTAGGCGTGAPYCATYTFSVPSQSPWTPMGGGTIKLAATPQFLIYAGPGKSATCSLPWALAAFQTDGQ